jgi:3-hydroxyisobutyrate dehydrogenase-like beta-hydroxyacid dehydrogenase
MIGLVGAGYMGSGLGVALMRGGADVTTTLAGRSARTRRFVGDAGFDVQPDLAAVVARSDVVLIVTPPAAALDAARDVARAALATGARPLVADLNAIAPSTLRASEAALTEAGLDLVDGAISGSPPTVRPGARIFLSGSRAAEIAALPWRDVIPVIVAGPVGQASAVKMCTASVYKGVTAIVTQALRTADAHGVLDAVVRELGDGYADPVAVASAAAKADRYVAEMREIASTQRSAGLTGDLFDAFAAVYADVATTPLAHADAEAVATSTGARPIADLVADLRRTVR